MVVTVLGDGPEKYYEVGGGLGERGPERAIEI